jgi:hypothetical protein
VRANLLGLYLSGVKAPEGSVRINPNGAPKAAIGDGDTPPVVRQGMIGILSLFLNRDSLQGCIEQHCLCSRKVASSLKTEWRRWDSNPQIPRQDGGFKDRCVCQFHHAAVQLTTSQKFATPSVLTKRARPSLSASRRHSLTATFGLAALNSWPSSCIFATIQSVVTGSVAAANASSVLRCCSPRTARLRICGIGICFGPVCRVPRPAALWPFSATGTKSRMSARATGSAANSRSRCISACNFLMRSCIAVFGSVMVTVSSTSRITHRWRMGMDKYFSETISAQCIRSGAIGGVGVLVQAG